MSESDEFYTLKGQDKVSTYFLCIYFVIHVIFTIGCVVVGNFPAYMFLLIFNLTLFPIGYLFLALHRNGIRQSMRTVLVSRRLRIVEKKLGGGK